jgi:outer membrane protein assembly factor BamD (BamD/ComL family)
MKKPWMILPIALVLLAGAGWAQTQAVSAPEDMIARARESYNNHRFPEAAAIYNEYLRTYPTGKDRDEAGFFHAQSLFLINDLAGAETAFSQEEGKNLTYADQILYYRGEIAARERNFSLAMVDFDRLLGEYPASLLADKARERRAELHFQQGDLYFSQGAYSLALQQYREAEAAPAELRPLVLYRLGQCFQKLQDYPKAMQAWGDLSAGAGPGASEAALLALYRLARLAEDQGLFAEAEVDYQRFLEIAPDHYLAPLAHEGLARVWAGLGKNAEAADYWKNHGQGSELLAASDRFEKTLDHFLHEEYPDAVTELKTLAAAADPEIAWIARLWLARVYTREGRTAEARAAWKEAAADPRASDPVRLEYAQAVLASDPVTARELAAAIVPKSSGVFQEEAMRVLARALFSTGSPEALAAADDYLRLYPAGRYAADMAFIRGSLLLDRGDLAAAETDLKRAAAEHTEAETRGQAASALIRLYQLQGRPDSALEVLARSRDDASSPADRLPRQEAEIAFQRGDYERGLQALSTLCPGKACSERDRMRLFFGNYRAGKLDAAQELLTGLASGSAEAVWFAGFWQGMIFFERQEYPAAIDAWRLLRPTDSFDEGLRDWQVARAQGLAGQAAEAAATLKAMEPTAPAAGFYVRGLRLKFALGAGDFGAFLASLPSPAEQDRDALSEQQLLQKLKNRAAAGAKPSELQALNRILQVEAAGEETAEEGTLIVASAGLNGPGRAEALAMLDRILSRHPGTPLAPRIKYYLGEDAYQRQDYAGTISWLGRIEPVDLPEELRFRLLYLKGQSYKALHDLDRMRPAFLALVRDYRGRPAPPRQWLDVGVGLTLAREFTAARAALDLALSGNTDPKLAVEATYWKGMVEAGTGDQDAALAAFLSIPAKFPDQGMWVVTALYEAAGIYTEKKQYDQALATYERALALAKGDTTTTNAIKGKIAEVKKLKRLQK